MLYEEATLEGGVRFTEVGLAAISLAAGEMNRVELLELLGIICGGAEFNVEVVPLMSNLIRGVAQTTADRIDLDSIITTEDV